jgi:hypothetical protein
VVFFFAGNASGFLAVVDFLAVVVEVDFAVPVAALDSEGNPKPATAPKRQISRTILNSLEV